MHGRASCDFLPKREGGSRNVQSWPEFLEFVELESLEEEARPPAKHKGPDSSGG